MSEPDWTGIRARPSLELRRGVWGSSPTHGPAPEAALWLPEHGETGWNWRWWTPDEFGESETPGDARRACELALERAMTRGMKP